MNKVIIYFVFIGFGGRIEVVTGDGKIVILVPEPGHYIKRRCPPFFRLPFPAFYSTICVPATNLGGLSVLSWEDEGGGLRLGRRFRLFSDRSGPAAVIVSLEILG